MPTTFLSCNTQIFVEPPAKHRGRGLKLIGNDRAWTLLATTREEAFGWTRALSLARERAVLADPPQGHLNATRIRVDTLRAEHQRLTRHAAALRELKARDAMVISL